MIATPLWIVGAKETVDASAEATITVETSDYTMKVNDVLFHSDGDFELQEIKIEALKQHWLAGYLHSEQLKKTNRREIALALGEIPPNSKVAFKVRDLSGASNTIYIALVGER